MGAVHAVAVGVAVRAMDGGASRMGFLLPSFSRRDNLTKYDKRMLILSIPGMWKHAVCSLQHNNQLRKRRES